MIWQVIVGVGTLLTAVFTAIAAYAAWKAAKSAARQAESTAQQTELSLLTLNTDLLMRLDDRFSGGDPRRTRRLATAYLLKQRFNPQLGLPESEKTCYLAVTELLDFFELVGLLVRRKILDEELAWHTFFHHFHHYFHAAKEIVEEERRKAPTVWEDLLYLKDTLTRIESQKRGKTVSEPSNENLLQFLEEELEATRPHG